MADGNLAIISDIAPRFGRFLTGDRDDPRLRQTPPLAEVFSWHDAASRSAAEHQRAHLHARCCAPTA